MNAIVITGQIEEAVKPTITEKEANMIKFIEGIDWMQRVSLEYDKPTLRSLIKKGLVTSHKTNGITRKYHRTFDPDNYNII